MTADISIKSLSPQLCHHESPTHRCLSTSHPQYFPMSSGKQEGGSRQTEDKTILTLEWLKRRNGGLIDIIIRHNYLQQQQREWFHSVWVCVCCCVWADPPWKDGQRHPPPRLNQLNPSRPQPSPQRQTSRWGWVEKKHGAKPSAGPDF